MVRILSLILLSAELRAESPTEADKFLADFGQRAILELTDASASESEKADRFRSLLDEGFDIPLIGQFIVARYWRGASAAEREEFLELFREYLVQRFLPLFALYDGQAFETDGLRLDSKNEAIAWVTIFFDSESGEPFRTDWRVRLRDGRYEILDVKAEGTSMAITLREEYGAVLKRSGGLAGLNAALRKQIAKGAEQS
jgi:phospholipid transport system substrate-binding protein